MHLPYATETILTFVRQFINEREGQLNRLQGSMNELREELAARQQKFDAVEDEIEAAYTFTAILASTCSEKAAPTASFSKEKDPVRASQARPPVTPRGALPRAILEALSAESLSTLEQVSEAVSGNFSVSAKELEDRVRSALYYLKNRGTAESVVVDGKRYWSYTGQ